MSDIMIGVGAFIITSAFWVVIIGNQFHNWNERCETLKAQVFGLEQDLIHEREGQTRPLYELATDGIDPVIRRRNPLADQESKREALSGLSGDVEVLDLTNVEDE